MGQRFTLTINCDNDIFQEDDPAAEIARILIETAARLQDWRYPAYHKTIFDANGNNVGRYVLKATEPTPEPKRRRHSKEYGRIW